MNLDRKSLRKLIIAEMQKVIDEEIILNKDDYQNYGMLAKHKQGHMYRSNKHKKCPECGCKMHEKSSMCEQCGYSMYEMETRKQYAKLNEGDCGCGSSMSQHPEDYEVLDYDADDDFIPDHMENLNNTNILPDEAIGLGIKIGNHKAYKGSYMAKSHLYKVNKYAEKLYHMIPDGHNLEDWMRTKLAQIADDIGEVYHALDHDKFEGDI